MNISGMTIDDIMARAAQLLDEQIGVARAKEVEDLKATAKADMPQW